MRVPRSSIRPPPTTTTTNSSLISSLNRAPTPESFLNTLPRGTRNIPTSVLAAQLFGNDFNLDLGELDTGDSASESFTLYKSDLDDCGNNHEENNDFSIEPGTPQQPQVQQPNNNSSIRNSGSTTDRGAGSSTPKQGRPTTPAALAVLAPVPTTGNNNCRPNESPTNGIDRLDAPAELRREVLKTISAANNIKRNESSPSSGTGASPRGTSTPASTPSSTTPTATPSKKQRSPKYQFNTETDFPHRTPTKPAGAGKSKKEKDRPKEKEKEKKHGIRIKKESAICDPPTSAASAPLSSSINIPAPAPVVNNNNNDHIIGPSASFTISIPSTSKTPATTMYLPFIARRQSIKSHQLVSADSNVVRSKESAEEQQQRRKRVYEAMNDSSTDVKDLKYFIDKNIERYLKKRGHLEPYLRAEKVISKGIFASIISHENSIANAVSYGPQYEAHEIMGELERFWNFYQNLKETNRDMSAEIRPMLAPLLLYFYLETFLNGLVPVALRLYVEYSKKFLNENGTKENYDVLYRIGAVTSPDAFDDNELLQAFRSQERHFIVSLETFERLKKYLLTTRTPIMLHLFTNRFKIQMKDTAEIAEKFVEYPYNEPQTSQQKSGSRAAEVIKKLRENVNSDLPKMSLYLAGGRPTSGAVSPSGSMIAFGLQTGRGITIGTVKDNKLDPETLHHLTGHSGSVFDVGFHPRTKRLYSVGQDCTMRVWDIENRSCAAVYRGHDFPIGALDIAESGVLLATGSIDTTARIWVPERTDFVRVLAGHYSDVTTVKFHPNEAYIATGSLDTSVRLWSISDGNMARVFTGFDGRVTTLAFHESGKYLLAGGADRFIRIWDIAQGEVLTQLRCPPNCTSLAINQNLLAAAFGDNQVRFWNLQTVLCTSSTDSEPENGTGGSSSSTNASVSANTSSSPSSRKFRCKSNTLFKLHFATPRHLIGLGESATVEGESTCDEEVQSPSSDCNDNGNSLYGNEPIQIPRLGPSSSSDGMTENEFIEENYEEVMNSAEKHTMSLSVSELMRRFNEY